MTTRHMGDNGFLWWFGKVIDNAGDPEKLGRVKIRVYNHHDDNEISDEDLLWAMPMTPTHSASSNGVGWSPTGIANGSIAVGFWVDGLEKNMPFLLGTYAAKIKEKSANGQNSGNASTSSANSSSNNKSDVSPLALGNNIIKDHLIGPEPKSAYAAKYPDNFVITTPSISNNANEFKGIAVELDHTKDHERIRIYHPAGTYIEINEKGRMVIKTPDDRFDVVGNNSTIYVKGKLTVQVEGDAVVSVKGTANVTAGTLNVNADKGDVKVKGVSLVNHVHENSGGTGTSGKPVQ
jgi:hypothetical protein